MGGKEFNNFTLETVKYLKQNIDYGRSSTTYYGGQTYTINGFNVYFPIATNIGQLFTNHGTTYKWNGAQWIVNNNRIHVHTPNNPCNVCDTLEYLDRIAFPSSSSASASAEASADASGNGEANANAKATANGSGAWATASSDAKTISLGK